MCHRFTQEGAAKVIVSDLNGEGAHVVAEEIGSVGYGVDVGNEQDTIHLIDDTESRFGPVNVWQTIWGVNTMSRVWAARGGGYLPNTTSAAGMIEPEQAVNAVVETLREERFLVLPHPKVAEYMRRKTADYDRWLKGMHRLQDLYTQAQ